VRARAQHRVGGAWRRLPDLAAGEWDALFPNFLEDLYDRGRPREVGALCVAALLWARPGLGKPLRSVLPLTGQSLAG
jgi:hypothetical protein